MATRVIQGFFVGGQARPAPGVMRAISVQRAAAPGPSALSGAPAPAFAGRATAVQMFCDRDALEIDAVRLGLVRSGGQPLPGVILAKMEAAFGANFSAVRIHVGPQAARIGAVAFTTGDDIYFAPGRYQPESVQGQQLLGHELAHVIQQRQGRVHTPASGVVVVQNRALEAEADRLGMRAAMYRAPIQRKRGPLTPTGVQTRPALRHPGAAPLAGRPIQRFSVVGPDKIMSRLPQRRPWFGYPYVVIHPTVAVSAQALNGGGRGVNEFLATGGRDAANVIDAGRRTLSLRVSDDAQLAIENSDLTTRQPKAFFATSAVIDAANRQLRGSVRLKREGGLLTVLTGWYSRQVLSRVVPEFTTQPSQNCNDIAGQITGVGGFITGRGGGIANDSLRELLGGDRRTFDMNADAQRDAYVRTERDSPGYIGELRLNAWARPEVGHAFMIGTVGRNIAPPGANQAQVLDVASGQVRTLNWGYHFGAVVARSGSDRVTLENYARGDNRTTRYDPRWYFQMYGEGTGQSFHEFHAARREYANPVTVSTQHRQVPRLAYPEWWNI